MALGDVIAFEVLMIRFGQRRAAELESVFTELCDVQCMGPRTSLLQKS